MPSHSTLSVAIIVRDAAEALDKTLAAVRDVADEIIVVDTGSTDASRDVARRFGVRVIEHKWDDDFSSARNRALEECTSSWVLWLDAGETLEQDDLAGLRDFVRFQADRNCAYALLVQVPPNGDEEAGEQIARLRLAPTLPGVRFEGRVRESVAGSLDKLGVRVEGLHFRVNRSAHEHDAGTKERRARRNVRLAQYEINAMGPSPEMLNCLGDAFQTLEDNRRAADCFREALSLADPKSPEMLEAYYGLLTSCGDQPDKQLSLCVEALEIYPLDAQLLCSMGGCLQAQGRFDLALKAYRTAYEHGIVTPVVWHVSEIREIAAICLSLTLQIHEQIDEAYGLLEQALAANERCDRLRRHAIEFCIKHNRVEAALRHADQLAPEPNGLEARRTAVRGALMAAQQNWIAARALLTTAYDAGCRDVLCTRWLAITHLATGEVENARPILEQWQQMQPKNVEVARYLQLMSAPEQDGAKPGETSARDAHGLRVDPGSQKKRAGTAGTDRTCPTRG